MKMAIGLIGVGIMGHAMLKHLLAHGHPVHVYDVSDANLARAQASGAVAMASATDIPATCPFVISSLPSVAALEATGYALAASAASNSILIEMSTLPHACKQSVRDQLRPIGMQMLDAPVSGTGAQAQVGDLTVLGSGDRAAFESARPVLSTFARSSHYLGAFGAGMTMKLLANHLVATHSLAAAEVLALGTKAGLDPHLIVDVLNDGAGASKMLAVRGPQMAAEQFDVMTASIDTLIKDLGLIQALAAEQAMATPLLDAVASVYRMGGSIGFGPKDISAIYQLVRATEPFSSSEKEFPAGAPVHAQPS